MARLPFASPGNSISLGRVLGLMGVAPSNISLDNTEVTAMGGAEVANSAAANSLCMPYQLEAIDSIAKNNRRAPLPESGGWVSTNPGNNWRPARLSEFQRAYNNKPDLELTTAETGGWRQCTVTCIGRHSDAYTGAGTPYYFYVTGGGSSSFYGDWTVAGDATKRILTFTVTGLAAGTNSFSGQVQDYEGCGGRNEFTDTTTYNAGNWSRAA